MEVDYYKIGQRIRHFRKGQGLSQEELAERVHISTTHMSHIETANTKPSFGVIVALAIALNVSIDYLVFGDERDDKPYYRQIEEVLCTCTPDNARIILGLVDSLNKLLNANET